jgi:type IV pilus assembly protein PilY1
MKPPFMRHSRLAAALMLGAAAGLASWPAAAQTTDLSQTPLASASNLSVLPNVLFVLDDSGSMTFDVLPDNVDYQTSGSEKKYWHESYQCKPRLPLATSSTGSLNGLPANHCDRMDPPLGAAEFNGLYYNPQITYRVPLASDKTPYKKQTLSSAECDPYGTGWDCDEWFYYANDYYQNGSQNVNPGSGNQNYNNPYIKQWYGTGSTFDAATQFPEIVYCSSASGDVNNLDQCRRNGLPRQASEGASPDIRHTGNPFRYSTARWGRGNTATTIPPAVPFSGGYPEAAPVHEFWRQSGSTTVTVGLAYPLSGSGTTVKIIPRTGTGTGTTGVDYRASGNCASNVCTATVDATKYKLTYSNGRNGERLSYASFDLISNLTRSANVVTVSNAFNHGLNVGDRIDVTQTTGSGSFGVTNVAITQVVDSKTFRYVHNGSNVTSGAEGYYRRANLYNYPKIRRGNPFYYTIEAVESCTDSALTTCAAGTTNEFPAPVRFCLNPYDAYRLDTPTGKEPTNTQVRCRKKYEQATGYIYPRYGNFRRVDVASGSTFTGRPFRSDCAARPTCSLKEEQDNFANWFSYYRHRMLLMKTAAGIAFSPIDDRYRVGFLTINPGGTVSSSKYLKIDKFTTDHRKDWYKIFYEQTPTGGTPLPEALSRAGRHFAGKSDGINKGMDEDPVQYSCQQNFTILTTDGYWNGFDGEKIDGSNMGNQDNVSSATPRPIWDGATDGGAQDPDGSGKDFSSSGTLADVALYYYRTDLRSTGSKGSLGFDVSENNVPTREDPFAPTSSVKTPTHQHMVTFGLGMAEGLMEWRADYESATSGDFANVKKGASGACSWTSGTCNWPVPANSRAPGNLDDLWHAAVNGRGKFFYARDTQAVQDGLTGALTSLQERNASGAAAATSTPNITPSDRGIFKTSYTTIQWNGEIVAQLIDPNTGSVLPGILWSAKDTLQGEVGTAADSRTIYIYDSTAPSGVKKFDFDLLTAEEQAWFKDACKAPMGMTQCSLLDPSTDLITANDGKNLVNFLRGHTQHEADIYRDRQWALGDTVNAVPLYISAPRFNFSDATDPTYLKWKTTSAVANRTPALYIGANDGMLHAFNANTGDEMWAFIPRQVAPGLYKLADRSYATKHQYYVDGSPISMDVWDGSSWRTILVGGLNAGGRGYYAIDVTVPNAPNALWEICHDKNLCKVWDENMGYSFGNPVITKRASDGKWVVLVTSGYNNVSPGDGKGYLYVLDALTGKILDTIATSAGYGLGKITPWIENFFLNNTTEHLYGGDLSGNMWKFDLTKSSGSVQRLGIATDANGAGQAITTKPELGLVDDVHKAVYFGTGRYLGVKDLTDPATQDPKGDWAWQQTMYGIKDLDMDYGPLRGTGNKLVEQTINELSGGLERTVTRTPVDWATRNGWYVDFNPGNSSPGERVTVDPQLVLGTIVVATNVPGGGACAIGGDSWIYQFDYRTGSYIEGAPKNLVARKQTGALTVGVVIYQLQKGSLVGQVQRSETSMMREDIMTSQGNMDSRRTSWREVTPELEQ